MSSNLLSTAARAAAHPVRQVPRKRLVEKVAKSAFGILIMAVGWYLAVQLKVDWKVYLSVFGIGAHIFSEEWTRAGVRFLVSIVRDLFAAMRGPGGPPPLAPSV